MNQLTLCPGLGPRWGGPVLAGVLMLAPVAPAWAQDTARLAVTPMLSQVPEVPRAPLGPSAEAALSLHELLVAVQDTHPALRTARLQARAAQEDVASAERLRWPTVALSLESATGGAASASPSRLLRVEQTLWDFGRVGSKVQEFQGQVSVAETQADQARQDLFLQAIGGWQQLLTGLERERVAARALDVLQGYQAQMQRRVDAQASAPIDLELVEARVLQVQADLAAARSLVQQGTSRLEQISGLRNLAPRVQGGGPRLALAQVEPLAQRLPAMDLAMVASEHPSVVRAGQEFAVLEKRLDVKKAEQWPQLYVRLDKPLDRTASVTSTAPSYFVGFRYTPSAGLAGHAEVTALATRLEGQALAAETAQREVLQAMMADREEFLTARSRMDGLERSVNSAKTVLASYQRQFQAARKSWLDLLNTVRDLSSSEYALAEARVSMVGAMHRLQLRLGQMPDQP